MIERRTLSTALAHLTELDARVSALEQHAQRPEQRPDPQPDPTPAQAPDPPATLPNPWLPVLHKPPGCGKPALYLTRPFRADEPADLAGMRICPPSETAWRQPAPDDVPVCSGCGAGIHPYSAVDLEWSRAIIPASASASPRADTAPLETETEPPPPYGHSLAEEVAAIRRRVSPDG